LRKVRRLPGDNAHDSWKLCFPALTGGDVFPPARLYSPAREGVNYMQHKGAMTVSEAGRRGGRRTAQTHGHDFYEEIGKKGGETTSEKYGTPFYEEIGHKGGQRVKELIEEGKRAAIEIEDIDSC